LAVKAAGLHPERSLSARQARLQTQAEAVRAKVEHASAAVTDAYAADDEKLARSRRTALETAEAEVVDLGHRAVAARQRAEQAQRRLDIFIQERALGDVHANPTSGISVPAINRRQQRFATVEQVEARLSGLTDAKDRALWTTALYACAAAS